MFGPYGQSSRILKLWQTTAVDGYKDVCEYVCDLPSLEQRNEKYCPPLDSKLGTRTYHVDVQLRIAPSMYQHGPHLLDFAINKIINSLDDR